MLHRKAEIEKQDYRKEEVKIGNGFGDLLTRRLNGLPLPPLFPLDDMAKTGERV